MVVIAVAVAPRVGAWIETDLLSSCTSVRRVAPRVGAWIGTDIPRYPGTRKRGRPPGGGGD